jgi:ketosteroid isomerase-like protein
MKHAWILLLIVFRLSAPAQGRLDSLVSAERAFAAAGLADGIRASFMAFFSDSAIAFSPAPYIFKDVVGKRPPPDNPHARTLRWEPVAGDIASSGDLGYTMGPYAMTDNTAEHAPTSYGFFLSVWKREAGGGWKVVLDAGTEATEEMKKYFGTPFRPLGNERAPSGGLPVPHLRTLYRLDRALAERQGTVGLRRAYGAVLDAGARALREGVGPIVGKKSILAHLDTVRTGRFLSPLGAGLSRAGDIGYTYGAYALTAGATTPAGYYVHVWKRGARSSWRLVVDREAPADRQ